MKKAFRIATAMLLITQAAFFSACKKDNDTSPATPVNSNATGQLMIHLHSYLGENEVEDYNTIYTTASGRKISLSLAQFYLSEFRLQKTDGSWLSIPGKKLLKVNEVETYLVGNVPAGNYTTISFKVGLAANDSILPADSAILNKPEMWFGSTPQAEGYVFLNVQGKIDTTTAGNGDTSQMQPFVYKIGTTANYKQVTMPAKAYTIRENQVEYIHMLADYSRLFDGILPGLSSNLSVTTTTANAMPPATNVANNIPLMFGYEE